MGTTTTNRRAFWGVRSGTGVLAIVGTAWLVIVGTGLAALSRYAGTPAPVTQVAAIWPPESTVSRPEKTPVLLMFAHPYCPCSRASIGELARLMMHVQGRVKPVVMFYRAADVALGWERSDLWDAAAMIPGIELRPDDQGHEAVRFGVAVSGHTLLYDGGGHLLFNGGITPARGHAGDNAGSMAIATVLNTGKIPVAQTPAFGCFLRHAETD